MEQDPAFSSQLWTPDANGGELSGLVIRRAGHTPDHRVWKNFVDGRDTSPDIDRLILDSWRRCSEMGVDPGSDDQIGLEEANESFESDVLLELADRLNPSLINLMVEHNLVFAITNAKGVFVYRDGHPGAMSKTENLGFVLSAEWSERSVGTNAIGTCLKVGFPLQVFGREHFRATHHTFRCTAAPFFSPSGQVMGCVDLSSQLDIDHSKNLELVIGVSRFFERVLLQAHAREMRSWPLALLEQVDQEQGGLVVVEANGLVCGLDAGAQAILGARALHLAGRRVDEVFDMSAIRPRPPQPAGLPDPRELVRTIRAPAVVAEVKRLWSPSGLWLGYLLKVLDPGQSTASVSRLARAVISRQAQAQDANWALLGDSAVSRDLRRRLAALARTPSTVLITGETGTGKERVARSLHGLGPRSKGPFIAVNCGAMSDTLIQSELFGYAPGSFTGADPKGRPGLFEQASGGVVFLDEIGDLPIRHQVNLLRVLEERAVTRVGAHDSRPVNVKVVAATNRDLAKEVEQGRFREDLFHRLNVMIISLPPLRERREDILPIARFHLARLAEEMGLPPLELSPEVADLFLAHSWPGNVRTLVNALEYACNHYFLAPFERVGMEHLPSAFSGPQPAASPPGEPQDTPSAPAAEARAAASPSKEAGPAAPVSPDDKARFADAERQILIRVLSDNNYNITRTAKSLGICRNTLYAKLLRHDISFRRL
jgi:transcriptional regulator of acetoin/glycerol metabolism